MELLFECSTQYLTSECSEQVRYQVEHERRNSISPEATMCYFVHYMNSLGGGGGVTAIYGLCWYVPL